MKNNRKEQILFILQNERSVRVKQLSLRFNVTEKTIRQDLIALEKKGYLQRIHGGAVIADKQAEISFSKQLHDSLNSGKELIAKAAYRFLTSLNSPGQIIFIDAGSTTEALAPYLKNTFHTIITNDLKIVSILSSMGGQVHCTGGELQSNFNLYFTGPDAIDMIRKHSATICFIGASSINSKTGFSTQTNADIEIKKAMIDNSKLRICLADHFKLNNISFAKFADFTDIDYLIIDEIDEEERNRFTDLGIRIISAQEYLDN